jgi:hypothetical protein
MNPILLHEHNEFPDLIRIVADKQLIDPVIVEKDYWIMHVLWGLQEQGFKFSFIKPIQDPWKGKGRYLA